MPWLDKDAGVTFECDTCDTALDCDVKLIRATAPESAADSDFIVCWRYLQASGWRSFKRTGRKWTYHCPACGQQAEADHHEHRLNEDARDRIKSRNAREYGG